MTLEGIKLYLRTIGVQGLIRGAFGRLTKTSSIMAVRPPHVSHPVHLRVPSTDVAVYEQIFVLREYELELGQAPEFILDAGANIGLASIHFANKYPNARILAIEPEAGNFQMLLRNTKPYPRIRAVQAAVWHKDEPVAIIDPGFGAWGFMTERAGSASTQHERPNQTVPGKTITTIMEECGVSTIDLLKIDIEGAELEVFSDAGAWIDRVNMIVVELHERLRPGCDTTFQNATRGFGDVWKQGEFVCLRRRSPREPVSPASPLPSEVHPSGGAF